MTILRNPFFPRSIRSIKVLIFSASVLLLLVGYAVPSLSPFSGLLHESSGRLSALSLDREAYEALKTARSPGLVEPQSLTFNGHALFYARADRAYFYSVTEGDKAGLDPGVAMTCADERCAIAFLRSPISPESIRENREHRFLVYSKTEYTEYVLAVTTLPLVSIDTRHPDVLGDSFITDKKSAAHMLLFDNDPHVAPMQRMIASDLDIRIRGATSRNNPQKSYRVFLTQLSLGRHKRDNALSLLGMRRDEDWILYAPYSEPDKMRNILATNLWANMGARANSFGVDNGTHGKYVELLINGKYQGIYGLMPPVDYKQLEMRVTDDPRTTEYFYRKISNSPAKNHDFQKGKHRNHYLGFELRYPKRTKNTYDKWAPLGAYTAALGGSREAYEAVLTELLELDNAIDFWIFVNATMGVDNIEKNVSYIAKHNDSGYVLLFSPWDMDQTWGVPWTGDGTLLTTVPGSFAKGLWIHEEMPIGRALLQNSCNIWEKVAKRYAALRQTALSDANVTALIADHARQVFDSGAIRRDHARWKNGEMPETPDALRAIVLARLAAMDSEIERLRLSPESLRAEPLAPGAGL